MKTNSSMFRLISMQIFYM